MEHSYCLAFVAAEAVGTASVLHQAAKRTSQELAAPEHKMVPEYSSVQTGYIDLKDSAFAEPFAAVASAVAVAADNHIVAAASFVAVAASSAVAVVVDIHKACLKAVDRHSRVFGASPWQSAE